MKPTLPPFCYERLEQDVAHLLAAELSHRHDALAPLELTGLALEFDPDDVKLWLSLRLPADGPGWETWRWKLLPPYDPPDGTPWARADEVMAPLGCFWDKYVRGQPAAVEEVTRRVLGVLTRALQAPSVQAELARLGAGVEVYVGELGVERSWFLAPESLAPDPGSMRNNGVPTK